MASRMLTVAVMTLCLGASAPDEPARFAPTRTVEGRSLALLGVGAHKTEAGARDYEMALYVDELDARRAFSALVARAGGRSRGKLTASDHAQSFVVWGHFTKLAVLRFDAATDAAALRASLKEGLDEELGDRASVELHKAADAFLALLDGDLKEGDELILRTHDDGRIQLDVAGVKKSAPQSPKLVRALWGIWLGAKPISTELRRALVDKIDLLGR